MRPTMVALVSCALPAAVLAACAGSAAPFPEAQGRRAPAEPPAPAAKADAPPQLAALERERQPGQQPRPAAEKPSGEWRKLRRFPLPDYSQPDDGPRVDFRDTVYWAPSVTTNDDGIAEVSFYLSDAITSSTLR